MNDAFNIRAFVVGVVRRHSVRTPMYSQARAAARKARGIYNCATCKGEFGHKEIQIDHINPVIPVTGWDSWDGYFDRLFCPASGLQCVCKPCHKEKTKGENATRRTSVRKRTSRKAMATRKKKKAK